MIQKIVKRLDNQMVLQERLGLIAFNLAVIANELDIDLIQEVKIAMLKIEVRNDQLSKVS